MNPRPRCSIFVASLAFKGEHPALAAFSREIAYEPSGFIDLPLRGLLPVTKNDLDCAGAEIREAAKTTHPAVRLVIKCLLTYHTRGPSEYRGLAYRYAKKLAEYPR